MIDNADNILSLSFCPTLILKSIHFNEPILATDRKLKKEVISLKKND